MAAAGSAEALGASVKAEGAAVEAVVRLAEEVGRVEVGSAEGGSAEPETMLAGSAAFAWAL